MTGLTHTWLGEGLGLRPDAPTPVLEPAMTYQVLLDDGQDPHEALQKLRQLAEEDPQLHISWDEETRQIRLQPMGPVQLDVLRRRTDSGYEFGVRRPDGRYAALALLRAEV